MPGKHNPTMCGKHDPTIDTDEEHWPLTSTNETEPSPYKIDLAYGGLRLSVFNSYIDIPRRFAVMVPDDLRIEVDIKVITSATLSSYGIFCLNNKNNAFAYYFLIVNNEFASIQKHIIDGEWIKLLPGNGLISLDNLNQGENTNHIRADCLRNQFSLYVNGVKAASIVDDSLPNGLVGLAVFGSETGNTEIVFDNFTLYIP
jgi:hypothetical protein